MQLAGDLVGNDGEIANRLSVAPVRALSDYN